MNDSTAGRILAEGRRLIMTRGYNGFSYADIAGVVGIRKASIHHHFPNKADLAAGVVEQSRAVIRQQVALLHAQDLDAVAALRAYAAYWERCIADDSAPFCVAAMLAAELPSLPPDLAGAVRAHFTELSDWLTALLTLGSRQGHVTLRCSARNEADAFMSAIYGAMLSARAFSDPRLFVTITRTLLAQVVSLQ